MKNIVLLACLLTASLSFSNELPVEIQHLSQAIQIKTVSHEDPEAIRGEVCELTSRARLLGRGAEQAIASVGYALIELCRESAAALKMTERAIRQNPENAIT